MAETTKLKGKFLSKKKSKIGLTSRRAVYGYIFILPFSGVYFIAFVNMLVITLSIPLLSATTCGTSAVTNHSAF